MINYNRFKDGKETIITMSYDDGNDADERLVEIFDRYAIKGTFHLNSGLIGKKDRIPEDRITKVYQNHEISCHSLTHPHFDKIPLPTTIQEVIRDRENLERITGNTVRGMSYPFGAYNEDVIMALKQCGIVYSRTIASTNKFGMPGRFLEWHPTCHHNQCLDLAKTYLENLNHISRIPLFYVWGHSFEFDRGNNWHIIEEFCKMVSGHDEIWYATNIEIYDYMTAQRRLQISADSRIVHNPSAMAVWFSYKGETLKIEGGETLRL